MNSVLQRMVSLCAGAKAPLCLIVLFVLSGENSVWAQKFDCRPLTCTIKDAGDFKVELAGCRNSLDIYLYRDDLKPVRGKPLSGTVDFFYDHEPPLQAGLNQYYLTNALSACIPTQGYIYCRVTITIDAEIICVYFDNECEPRAQRSPGHEPQQ